MELRNPIHYLLEHYYHNKYIDKKKTYRSKSINYYVGLLYNKTERNKKFNKITYVYNPFLTFYYKRHIVKISKNEINEILDLIDDNKITNNMTYHYDEYYQLEPLNEHEHYALYNYNFYDMLFFDYMKHKNRKKLFRRLKKHEQDKLYVQFT